MSSDTKNTVAELLAPMLKKTLFVAISRVAAPASEIEPFVADHLAYMNALEADGRLWASGPFIQEGVLVGDGLTILTPRNPSAMTRYGVPPGPTTNLPPMLSLIS